MTVEVVQSFKDEPLTVCGVCGGRLRRVFHPVGIVLKGSGFYSTDNRSAKKPAATAKPKDDKTSTDTGSSPAESKPDKGKKDSGGSSAQAS